MEDKVALSNLNLHYHPIDEKAYVSPDEMVVVADLPPNPSMGSYRVGETGPAPVLVVEVLSKRTYQQQDISPTGKLLIYADLGVAEYILVDVNGAVTARVAWSRWDVITYPLPIAQPYNVLLYALLPLWAALLI